MTELCSWKRALPTFGIAALLTGCGSKTALVIGSDENDAATPICSTPVTPPLTSLIHRYSFSGTTTTVTDSIGSADGQSTVIADASHAGTPGNGPVLDGSGVLSLDGTSNYVELPNGIVSSLTDVTIVAWTAWRAAGAYERVFDFGTSTLGEGVRDRCKTCLLVMTGSGDVKPGLCAQLHGADGQTDQITADQVLDTTERQVALVVKSHYSMTLYLDGVAIASQAITHDLSEIMDQNDWLGLSQYTGDRLYQGSYDEFRIYNRALDPCEIAATVASGPDQL